MGDTVKINVDIQLQINGYVRAGEFGSRPDGEVVRFVGTASSASPSRQISTVAGETDFDIGRANPPGEYGAV